MNPASLSVPSEVEYLKVNYIRQSNRYKGVIVSFVDKVSGNVCLGWSLVHKDDMKQISGSSEDKARSIEIAVARGLKMNRSAELEEVKMPWTVFSNLEYITSKARKYYKDKSFSPFFSKVIEVYNEQ